jgi:hypothetical protein
MVPMALPVLPMALVMLMAQMALIPPVVTAGASH